ncbi:MAG TPA: hypothetical protein PKY70_16025 [Nakamurella multipartita]|nr:hypothetical protein [Nakamurella multipartita]
MATPSSRSPDSNDTAEFQSKVTASTRPTVRATAPTKTTAMSSARRLPVVDPPTNSKYISEKKAVPN